MVMHARKTPRLNDGYYDKHTAHPYQGSKYSSSSKRDYDRETSSRSSSNYLRDRDNSPKTDLTNGINSYSRADSAELESPPRDSRDRDRDRDRGDRYQSLSYIQKMKERDRERDYKKDKYSDKRDRRDRDSEHRTNHDRIVDRRTKIMSSHQLSSIDKHLGSDDRDLRDRDRDRERDRDRDRDRGGGGSSSTGGGGGGGSSSTLDRNDSRMDRERLSRIGDWSEHVSSSGKKYYYNCKTEVSQWEKPKEWLDKERTSKDQHRDYREKERERERDDRFSRSSTTSYAKHSNSSREHSRLRWPNETESSSTSQRKRIDESQDMDISPGDSTPTSEAEYSHSKTPTINQQQQQQQTNSDATVLLSSALPRLASHPLSSTSINSQLHFSSLSGTSGNGNNNSIITTKISSTIPLSNLVGNSTLAVTSTLTSATSSSGLNVSASVSSNSGVISSNLENHSPSQPLSKIVKLDGNNLSSASPTSTNSIMVNHTTDMLMNSNTPGPPSSNVSSITTQLPKMLSQIIGNKSMDSSDMHPHKALQTINNALRQQQQHQQQHQQQMSCETNQISNLTSNNLREHNSSLYNLTHLSSMAILNHTTSLNNSNNNSSNNNNNNNSNNSNINSTNINGGNGNVGTSSGISTTTTQQQQLQSNSMSSGISSQFSAAGFKSDGSSNLINNNTSSNNSNNNNINNSSMILNDGPPTPTQELDITGNNSEHRKLDSSASLSSLQGVVTSSQSSRSQGPSLTPSLANYFRADLIAHVTNWPAELLEKQALKGTEESHIVGDLQCTKVSADLKIARSLVRIGEISSTLELQKRMYLKQQVQRLEDLKSPNSFMSDDPS